MFRYEVKASEVEYDTLPGALDRYGLQMVNILGIEEIRVRRHKHEKRFWPILLIPRYLSLLESDVGSTRLFRSQCISPIRSTTEFH